MSFSFNNISVISTCIFTNYTAVLNASHNNIKNDGVIIKLSSYDRVRDVFDMSFNKLTTFTLQWQSCPFREIRAKWQFYANLHTKPVLALVINDS